ncbi:hypothetical protein GCM10027035_22670 [Emticicia sediminis]
MDNIAHHTRATSIRTCRTVIPTGANTDGILCTACTPCDDACAVAGRQYRYFIATNICLIAADEWGIRGRSFVDLNNIAHYTRSASIRTCRTVISTGTNTDGILGAACIPCDDSCAVAGRQYRYFGATNICLIAADEWGIRGCSFVDLDNIAHYTRSASIRTCRTVIPTRIYTDGILGAACIPGDDSCAVTGRQYRYFGAANICLVTADERGIRCRSFVDLNNMAYYTRSASIRTCRTVISTGANTDWVLCAACIPCDDSCAVAGRQYRYFIATNIRLIAADEWGVRGRSFVDLNNMAYYTRSASIRTCRTVIPTGANTDWVLCAACTPCDDSCAVAGC